MAYLGLHKGVRQIFSGHKLMLTQGEKPFKPCFDCFPIFSFSSMAKTYLLAKGGHGPIPLNQGCKRLFFLFLFFLFKKTKQKNDPKFCFFVFLIF